MAILRKAELIQRYNKKQLLVTSESFEKVFAASEIKKHGEKFSLLSTYDIFLSHSYDDARIIKLIKEMLEEKGYSVYVDWIEDNHFDRKNVNAQSAGVLRERMNGCASLIYITSVSAEKSVWMPWELGYMDAKTGRVAVAPILDEEVDFDGREYLGLYPYLDLTNDSFYIHRRYNEWVSFPEWLKGENPKEYHL